MWRRVAQGWRKVGARLAQGVGVGVREWLDEWVGGQVAGWVGLLWKKAPVVVAQGWRKDVHKVRRKGLMNEPDGNKIFSAPHM